jgi:hypothetical protein
MPASGDSEMPSVHRSGDAERCVVGFGRVAPEAGWESFPPPHEAIATESRITASTARVTARRVYERLGRLDNA